MNNREMTIKEFLLSKGINPKQETYKREIRTEDESFYISIGTPLKHDFESLSITSKEVFCLTYKCLDIIKNQSNFNIAYVPKNLVLKGKTDSFKESMFEIEIFDYFSFNNSNNFNGNCNISIIDTLDKVSIEKVF